MVTIKELTNKELTEIEKEYYFEQLDKYLEQTEPKLKKIKQKCCNDRIIKKCNTYMTCISCGTVQVNNYELVTPNTYLNQRFHNCTIINRSHKYKNINRLQTFSNFCYTEVIMNKSFVEITNICNKLKLPHKVINGSKIRYKEIFIDLKISSRSFIKIAMYIYCIYYSCKFHKIYVNIDDLIKVSDIDQKHYDKLMIKLEKKNVIFKNKKIMKLIEICNEKNIIIDKELLINSYKEYKKKIKKCFKKLNNNSIILGLLYNQLNMNEIYLSRCRIC